MSFLKRLLGGEPERAADVTATLYEGDVDLEVRGESFYQENLQQVVQQLGRSVLALLVPEPKNPYDSNAVAVWVGGLKVGHLSREDAEVYQPAVIRLQREAGNPVALTGRIVGGDSGKSFGIWLKHDPEDFGLAKPSTGERLHQENRDSGGVFTGSAAAEMTWMDRLPSDQLAAIKKLRQLLVSESGPADRHFMYLELEKFLYKCRDVFESALAEFETTCEQHHEEMKTIRPALVAALGGVPFLPTYRQMVIMKQKAHDFVSATDWAQRGLSMYGSDALRQEDVDDLQNRVAKLQGKLAGG